MAIQRLEHVGIVVEDLGAAIEFFVGLGLELRGEGSVEGEWVDRIIGLGGARSDIAMLRAPDGGGDVELCKFHSPPSPPGEQRAPANAPGLRHLAFTVDDLDVAVAGLKARGIELVGEVEDAGSYRLCYVRGPEGIIVELAEPIG